MLLGLLAGCSDSMEEVLRKEFVRSKPKAEQGDAEAQAAVGSYYRLGCGVAHDYEQAVLWFRKAAEQGNADGQIGLGDSYAAGEGVAQDHVKAFWWYRKAAAQGDAKAYCHVGNSYLKGKGVVADKVEAYAYYDLAATISESAPASVIDLLTSERARANIGIMEKEMTAGQIADGKKRANELQKELKTKKAEVKAFETCKAKALKGEPEGQHKVGLCYYSGDGVAKDEVEAVKWFRKAADQGFAPAQFDLGECYQGGDGVGKDETEALRWYHKAAAQENAWAQWSIGSFYLNGLVVAKDEVEAVKWFRKAADQGHGRSHWALAECYLEGVGVPKDTIEGYAYWNLGGIKSPFARAILTDLEKKMSREEIAEGQRRARELQKEIEAKTAAKKAGK